jgi:multiple sugar transport system substrate-binding protein
MAKSEESNISRRKYLQIAGAGVAGLVVGGALGYVANPGVTAPPTTVTNTVTETVTGTVTAPPTTVAMTIPPKPDKIRIVTEEDALYTKMYAPRFKQLYGIDLEFATGEYSNVFEKETADFMAGGGSYDVVDLMFGDMLGWAKKGYITSLDPFMAASGHSWDEIAGGEAYKSISQYNGTTYCFPSFISPVGIWVYRTDVYNALGLTPPKTMQDVLTLAKATTKKDASGKVSMWGECEDWNDDNLANDWWYIVKAHGGRIYDENGYPVYNDDKGQMALQWMKDFYDSGTLDPDTLNIDSTGTEASNFRMGLCASHMDSPWTYTYYNDPKESQVIGKFAWAKMPANPPLETACADFSMAWGLASKGNTYWGWKFLEMVTFDYDLNLARGGYPPDPDYGSSGPALKAVYSDPKLLNANPFLSEVLESISYTPGFIAPYTEHDIEIYKTVYNVYLKQAIRGETSVKDALDAAVQKHKGILGLA